MRYPKNDFKSPYSKEKQRKLEEQREMEFNTLKRIDNLILNKFADTKVKKHVRIQLDGAEGKLPEKQKMPSSINMFPTIGQSLNDDTYVTQNMRNQEFLKERPLGYPEDGHKKEHNWTKHELKEYKNSAIVTKDMLIKRKRLAAKKQGNK